MWRPRSESKGESVAEISEEPYDTAEEAERSAELLRAAHTRLDKLFAEVMGDIPSGNMDALRTEVAALLTNLSETELNNRRISAKSLSRLFNHKLTQSRRAASVSLEQQALKLEAQHHHSLRRLSDANGLSDMPARAETAEAACAECKIATGSLLAALGELGVAQEQEHKASLEAVVCEVKSWLLSLRGERDVLAKNLVGSRADAQRLRVELSTLNAEKHTLCAQLGACHSSMEASEQVREGLQARLDAQMHAAVEAERAALVQAAQLEEAMRAERAKLAALEHEIHAMLTTLGIELDGALDPNAKLRELLERIKQAKEAAEARAVTAETELAAARSQKAVLGLASLPTTEVMHLGEVPVPVPQRKLSLYEQDWQRAHRQTSEELTHCRTELATALEALAHASDELQAMTLRAMRLEEVRRNERTGLVKATLSSLHQLRLHLVETLCGLRERSSRLDERHLIELPLRATAHAREETSPVTYPGIKQRWGGGVGGESERVTVRVELPASPSHAPSGSSQGARTSSPLSSSPSARPVSAVTSAKLLPSHPLDSAVNRAVNPLDSAGFISAGFTASGFMATARGQSPQSFGLFPQSPPQTSPFTRRRGARSSSCASLQSPALTSPSMLHCLPGAAHHPQPLSLPSSPTARRARHEHAEQRLPPSPDNPPSVFLPPWNPPGIARASEANGVDDLLSSPDVASPRGAAPAAAASRMRARSQDLDRLSTAHLQSGTRPRTALPNAPPAS